MQGPWLALAAVFGVVLTPMPGSAQRADPRRLVIGRWELNVAKSTLRPGPPPKSWTRVYEASGENVKYTDSTVDADGKADVSERSEEHTSELQSQSNLVCRLLLEKKKKKTK